MALRTTADRVKVILGADYDGRRELAPFIRSANIVVNRAVTLATSNGETIASDTLLEAEGWVAAGHYVRSDRIYTSKSTLSASGSFKVEGENPYLQTARDLDPNIDAALSTLVGGWWLGKTESEALDYATRNGVL